MVKPFWLFQIVKPQPGSDLLFHDEQPKPRRFSRISPSPLGHGPELAAQRRAVRRDDLRAVAVGQDQLGRLRALQRRLARLQQPAHVVGRDVKPLWFFQIVNPQPGSFLLLYERAAEGGAVLADLAVAVRAGASVSCSADRRAVLAHDLGQVALAEDELGRPRAVQRRLAVAQQRSTSSRPIVKPCWLFQIVNPQPGSFLLL